MENEYVISFSSFYKAAYAQEELSKRGITATLRKLPTELVRSCSTGLYLRAASIDAVREVLDRKNIVPGGIYRIQRSGREKTFVRVKV